MSKWMESMIKKHGSEEAVREYMRQNGRKGGKAKVKKGFASMDRDTLKEVASNGGKALHEKYRQLNK